ncbi:class I SAM-dependent methyltransferase [Streptantibioticus cattleyicolor]|uniref:ToxA protein n=1 Tax=Streptantibioticus cattleyicolor (strain ATCC 35852 / DSM 46488 / JCM 4925 / NBRC 14057 / NRRL 8057) TaxID=1003195 RepID=F8JN09_STREN|nr:class I SAM-dependent methyltransferase [Streptantibioticus cattleyicolor]AEW98293.1 ToxA protein [Streptantibioticus cattleyicolor NRRL 8057 = DSM 46488]CCB72648.1 ToxA protein [Streptantibioticus cattleyicolor NRRL 8057 = DSM 46488]
MSVQQYDEIGEAFEGFKALPLIRYGEVPSFLGMVGDVSGKSVLDLACGTGFYSRQFKRRGATDVFGVDISAEMIAVARQMEEREPLGVRYDVGDVTELRPTDRRFDIALGVQCLNYAESATALERMCRNIHQSLPPGGEFFVFAQKPDYRFDCLSLEKYGFRCEPTGEETEMGPRVRVTALLDPRPISIVSTVPRREVYERCLAAAGFSDVEWVPLRVSDAGIREFGEDFWADVLAKPPLEMLRCRA